MNNTHNDPDIQPPHQVHKQLHTYKTKTGEFRRGEKKNAKPIWLHKGQKNKKHYNIWLGFVCSFEKKKIIFASFLLC